ncbi:hypothetical protein H0H81_009092 [Sphagnurus paluster]|uniref:Protein kinase domain-containing protein n=1 Tax=Sphagnurus paluster TaxID=117069 RepID=A0A9P7GKA1_9AGAR|nr:hypothetical protein H0H81_009092 [Sphagnurus paluster]
MVDDFKAIANQALKNCISSCTLPSTTDVDTGFPTLDRIAEELDRSPHFHVKNEADIQDTYETNMAAHCLVVASTLHFQLPVWSSGYLKWTKKYQQPTGEKYAIADGFLSAETLEPRPSWLPAQPCPVYSRMIKDGPLGIWEFKNLVAGSMDTFKAIRDLCVEDKFPWQVAIEDLKVTSTKAPKPPFPGTPFLRIRIPTQEFTARGALCVSGNQFSDIANQISGTVFVKNATSFQQQKALREEFKILHKLRAAGVLCVPIPIGLFRHKNLEQNPAIKISYASLVQEDVGKISIARHRETAGRKVLPPLVKECLKALKEIHKAGYCLGEISLDDIIVRARGFGMSQAVKKIWIQIIRPSK